jgi:HPr kinase/phosphorylase
LDGAHELLHATAIATADQAVLIRGRSGSGKSDLALRCLTLPASWLIPAAPRLVADDQVLARRSGNGLIVSAPSTLRGLMEVRGVGVLTVDPQSDVFVSLIVDLVENASVDRMPDPWPTDDVLGVSIPVLRLAPFEASAPLKIFAALNLPDLPRARA